QEEAPSLGTPVVVMRDTTERPEGVGAGLTRLAGTSRRQIVAEARAILDADSPRRKPLGRANPYGDGRAAQRIVGVLLRHAGTHAPARRAHPRRGKPTLA